MGSGASKESLPILSSSGINVISGQQARKRVILKFRKLRTKECIRLGISTDSLEVTSGRHRRYIVARQVHGIREHGFRQQQIRDAAGRRVLCVIAMDWGANATNCNCYGPTGKNPKSMRKLFTLKRGDQNNFWAEIINSNFANGSTTQFLDVPLRTGSLRHEDHKVARMWNHKLIVKSNIDQVLVVALALMTTEIRRLRLYTKMLMYSKPTPNLNQEKNFGYINDKVFGDSGRVRMRKAYMDDYDSEYSSRKSWKMGKKRLYGLFGVRKGVWKRPQSVSSIIDSYSRDTVQPCTSYYRTEQAREPLLSHNRQVIYADNKI